ncbi:MAG TPA: TylF/MycF/NovP-related O-methyltransferase [Thermodesulfovibrionia bacterium]|nr:TylF/MycF/NovP-related O-methyltransferase [Thermodesulfovibrionia bacterium]
MEVNYSGVSTNRVVLKRFNPDLIPSIERCKELVRTEFNLNPINNVNLLCEKAFLTRHLDGHIIECGVFQGTTLFTLAAFCREHNIKKTIWGFDTFGGFPDGQVHSYDRPEHFNVLKKRGENF